MNLNNYCNLKVTEYANKNILQHKQSKSIDLPLIQNNNSGSNLIKNIEYSESDKRLLVQLHPSKNLIMTDLNSLFNRYDSSIISPNKQPSKSDQERLKIKKQGGLVYYDKFYNEFKVS